MRWRYAAAAVAVACVLTLLLLLLPSDAPLHSLVSTASTSTSQFSPAASPVPARSAVPAGPVLPSPSGTDVPTAPGLASALRPSLTGPPLGGHTGEAVVDVATGQVLLRRGQGVVQPASTLKLLTAAAALSVLGPRAVLTTQVVAAPGSDHLVLVGGGDATLASTAAAAAAAGTGSERPASMDQLARATAQALKASGRRSVQLRYDASMFGGPRTSPTWPATYVTSGVVSPVTALSVDEGRTSPGGRSRSLDPPAAAAGVFAVALRHQGIFVVGRPLPGSAPASAVQVASVSSPPVSALVQRMLTQSDDDLAEALAHSTAVAAHLPGTFAGGAVATRQALQGLGLSVTGLLLVDGSGLSHADRVPPVLLAQVLALAAGTDATDQTLGPILSGLPVAGWTGTLADRFRVGATQDAAGLVRAKTGTLSTVSGLAGTVVDANDRVLAFAVVADGLPAGSTLDARAALDEAATALAACGCG
ncbi:MAG TPA: D-alanyl-D-alanine carboxypeptidase/D-alanyl-D-alanine-endopeptidase [Actinomycetes bacterium]|nr:D-alanyl-D-alanine carboxypeptidase/D-alanyl-D-alanine-endopeptidase [Actinomycetes bacterium]